MNIVLDVAQGVLGDFSDLLFFTEFFGGVPELSWDPKKAGCVMDNPKITWMICGYPQFEKPPCINHQ